MVVMEGRFTVETQEGMYNRENMEVVGVSCLAARHLLPYRVSRVISLKVTSLQRSAVISPLLFILC